MKRVRTSSLILMVLAVTMLAAACGGGGGSSSGTSASPGGSGTVVLWHGDIDVERAALDELSAQYNAQDPAWKIDMVFSGNSDYALQKLLTAMAGG